MDLKDYLEALKVERANYARYNRTDRVADVDVEIKRVEKALGIKAEKPEAEATPAKRPVGRPRKEASS